jgi:hypothetical protein
MFSKPTIEKVISQAQVSAAHSWEYGTIFEALLEYHNPNYTVFHDPFPNKSIPKLSFENSRALQYIKPFINTDSPQLSDGKGKSMYIAYPENVLRTILP